MTQTKLELKVEAINNSVNFEVIDDGCGIEKDKLNTIFSGRITNTEYSSDSTKQFIGIGLSVCATIIKAHGGKIWARNNTPNGMCFGFQLEREVTEDE